MKWKNIFSLPKRKNLRKKIIEQLNQPESPFDSTEVMGGTPATPQQPEVGWLRSETSNTPKF
ncbi:hypothetical protein M0L20_25665 [Spirosoma sp. RP8]|uniref:Uncharacterized protein n=1 Tax=Spirosoma liriopis TaxID=2937440 RepID=A0ABT0HSX7_9BACT|nr:hypothetical protein [Spirosoma liriopis]MCK8495281.1 hypothetical protein [Spirosoma liriopis]